MRGINFLPTARHAGSRRWRSVLWQQVIAAFSQILSLSLEPLRCQFIKRACEAERYVKEAKRSAIESALLTEGKDSKSLEFC